MSADRISGLAQALNSEPVEDSGSDTASRYNFQNQCAARHCFAMLKDTRLEAIICEWHVDYILIYGNGENELVSVKHREDHLGPWSFSELWTKGGLSTLYERWKGVPEARCRLVTNAAMKSGKDRAMDFSKALSENRLEDFIENVCEKLDCETDQAESFMRSLSIEYGIPDRVTLRSHQIVNYVEQALTEGEIEGISPAEAWDSVVKLVAEKSRDLDNRDFSAIDLSNPIALDSVELTSAKVTRRTIRRNDVIGVLATPNATNSEKSSHISNLWMREPSSTFVGRGEILQEISQKIESDSYPALAILGMSGVGKSEIISQYAWSVAESYDFVWWVRADSWSSVMADLTFLAEKLGLPAPSSDSGIHHMKQYLSHNRGLLLMDGASADPEIVSLIPNFSATRFLISSLDQRWSTHVSTLQVAPLAEHEANHLLQSLLADERPDELAILNSALKGLPLALKQAAGYINVSGMPVATYSTLVRDRAHELMSRAAPSEHIGLTAAMSITLDRLRSDFPIALEFLSILSYMAAHGFPSDLFMVELATGKESKQPNEIADSSRIEVEQLASAELGVVSADTQRLLSQLKDRLILFDAVADLQKFSLVDSQQSYLAIHALTQAVVRQFIETAQERVALEAGTVLIHKVANLSPMDSRYWSHYQYMMPHFDSLAEYLESRSMLPANRLMFLAAIALNLNVRGAKQASLEYAEKASSAVDSLDGISIETTLFVRTVLVEALTGADRWDDALHAADEGLNIQSGASVNKSTVSLLRSKKAAVLHLQGRLNEAMLEFDKVEADITDDGDPEGNSSIRRSVRASKATLLRESGDAHGAVAKFKELISSYPEDASRNGLAALYSNLSLAHLEATEFSDALEAAQKALVIDYENSDGLHLDAARDWNNAGLALIEIENTEEAAEAFQESLRIHKLLNEMQTSQYLIVLTNLGRAQMAQGDYGTARKTFEEALRAQERIVGTAHREVAATLANLSVAYCGLRLFGDAVSAAHRAIKIDVQVYGEGHPELMPDYNNIAGALMMNGSYRAALKWIHKAYLIAEKIYEADNVRVANCLEKIAICEYGIGNRQVGINVMTRALAIYSARLSVNHPQSQLSRVLLEQMMAGKSRLDYSADLS
ncbi:dsDNA nuclease domain-containing protein [Streptomyces atratus]|uniref:dsDNA nuclease domain-containing protein n=1 Tax=Streptomyces atratus TaxID=1893 RepID=UPI002AC32658|nr:dsDNA nuclease domain-containing protein [Streptomyces atratus]WPW30112.1 dsDNA nuclease domain-containing protein [Streptomyces atratus]